MYPVSPEYTFVYLAALRELAEWDRSPKGGADGPAREGASLRRRLRALISPKSHPAHPAAR